MKLKKLFSFVSLSAFALSMSAQIESGNYLIQNVGTGKYLGAANDWGTRASMLANGDLFKAAKLDDGTYTLESKVTNGGSNYYLGTNGYCDSGMARYTIEEVEGGVSIKSGDKYFTTDGKVCTFTADQVDANSTWKFISKNDAIIDMFDSSEENPVDVTTFFIKDANFGRNNRDASAWQRKSYDGTANVANCNINGGNNDNMCAESWRSNNGFNIFQEITDIPNGKYILKAQAVMNNYDGVTENLPVVYANDQTAAFNNITEGENSMGGVCTNFSKGMYEAEPIAVEVKDGKLTIGVKSPLTAIWALWDNFRLLSVGVDLSALKDAHAAAVAAAEALFTENLKEAELEELQSIVRKNMINEEDLGKAIAAKTFTIEDAINVAKEQIEYNNTKDFSAAMDALNETFPAEIAVKWSEEPNLGGQHWDGTDTKYFDVWSGNATTKTYTAKATLPAGKYALKAAGRGQAGTTTFITVGEKREIFNNKGDQGYGISTDGKANFYAEEGVEFANGGNGRGWEWRAIEFELTEETEVEFTAGFNLNAGTWASLCQPVLRGVAAGEEDYAALAAAIEKNADFVKGFEEGEYAPYVNAENFVVLAEAQAIDTKAVNAQCVINKATEDLVSAEWIVNEAFVQPIYDGSFDNTEVGKIDAVGVTGWTGNTGSFRQVIDVESLESHGLYTWSNDIKYGEVAGYELPLVGETYYTLSFKHASWDLNEKVIAKILCNGEVVATQEFAGNPKKYTDEDAFVTRKFVFKTEKAGNYVVELDIKGNTVTTGVELTKTVAADLELIAERATNELVQEQISLTFNYPVEINNEAEAKPYVAMAGNDYRKVTEVKVDEEGVYTFTFDKITDEGDFFEFIIPAGYFTFQGENYEMETKIAFESGMYDKVEADTKVTEIAKGEDGKITEDAVLTVAFVQDENGEPYVEKNGVKTTITIFGSEFLNQMGANVKVISGYLTEDGKKTDVEIKSDLIQMNTFEITLPTEGLEGDNYSAILPAGFFLYLNSDFDWNGALNQERHTAPAHRAAKALAAGKKVGEVQEIRVNFSVKGGTTAVDSIQMTSADGKVYDLSGRATVTGKGIVIKNGKKVLK